MNMYPIQVLFAGRNVDEDILDNPLLLNHFIFLRPLKTLAVVQSIALF
jgi:hypothetical protein